MFSTKMFLKSILLIELTIIVSSLSIGVQRLFPELNTQYHYILKSNISSGTLLPSESDSHWTLESNLDINVFNQTYIQCQLHDIKTSVFNKKQHYPSTLPSDASAMKNAWEIIYNPSGTVYAVLLSPNEPIWSGNLKKGISLNLQLQKPEGSNELSFNANEPCLHGVCNVEYTSVEPFTVRKTHDIPTSDAGYGRYLWNSVPVDTCAEKYNKHSFIGSAERIYNLDHNLNLKDMSLRSTLQYYTHNYLLAISTEMSLNFVKTSPLKTNGKLNLVPNYPGYYPHFYKEPTNGRNVRSQEQLFNDTKQILLKISRNIDTENIVRNSSLIHSLDFLELHKTMAQMTFESLTKLYNMLAVGTSYEIETCKNIYLEVLPYVKTSDCALVVKYLLTRHKDQIEDATLVALIRKLPFNVANYSQELLVEMECFTILGPEIPQDIRYAAILSFATLTYYTYKNGACTSDYFENIIVKYFRMYSEWPQYIDKMIWLQGLSNLQEGSVYSYLAPKIISKETNRHERFLGLLATLPTAAVDPVVATVLSWPILTNNEEHIQLRIAALLQLLASDLTPGRLLAIHEYIVKSNNAQLKRFWFTTIKSLDKNTYSCYQPLTKYISYVSKLVSTSDSRFWSTGNFIVDSLDEERNSVAMMQMMSIGDPLTGLPEVIQFNIRIGQGSLVTSNLVLIIKAVGVSLSFYKRIHKIQDKDLEHSFSWLTDFLKENMKAKVVNPEKVHIEIIAKYHDKTVYATHMNQSRFDSWKLDNFEQSVEDFLRFGSHINQQTVLYPTHLDTNLATELGTPVTLQTTFTSFWSIRGNLSAPFTTRTLTWKNDVHFRYQATILTALSTAGPILPSEHIVRIQQSMVAHLPLKFDVSLSPTTRSFQLRWPNPGTQNGGIAMHARTQIAMKSPKANDVYTVITGDNKYSVDDSGIFFDCDRPMTGAEMVDKLLNSHYDIISTLRPPIIILQGLFLLSVPPSGTCGVILPPSRPFLKSGNHVLEVEVQVNQLELTIDDNFILEVAFKGLFREDRNNGEVHLNMSGNIKLETANRDKSSFSLTLSGIQPHAVDPSKKNFNLCLKTSDKHFGSSEQDLSPYPSAYEGNVTFAYDFGSNQEICPKNGTRLHIYYNGRPTTGVKGMESVLQLHIFGRKLLKLNSLSKFGIRPHTMLGQILQNFDREDLDLDAVIKAHGGSASLKLDKGEEMQFTSNNFNWLLDNWNNMQLLKKFGIYRECRLHEGTVDTLLGTVERRDNVPCSDNLAMADCGNQSRFAIVQRQNGGYILYAGVNHVTIEPPVNGISVVKVNDKKINYDSGYTYPNDETVYDLKITRAGDAVKVQSKISGVILYYKPLETTILVPHIYLSVGCGSCMSHHYYNKKNTCV